MFLAGQIQKPVQPRVIERPDDRRDKPQRGGLEQDILAGMASFHRDIAIPTAAVCPGGARVDRGENDDHGAVLQPALPKSRCGHLRPFILR